MGAYAVMVSVLAALAALLILPAVCVRAFALAPTRLGWVFHLSNVVSDTVEKRLSWRRGAGESALAIMGIAVLVGAGLWADRAALTLIGAGLAVSILLLDRQLKALEVDILGRGATHVDRRRSAKGAASRVQELRGAFPDPSPHPDLVLNLVGPFISRRPRYQLGDLIVERPVEITLLVANHSEVPCLVEPQVRVRVRRGALRVDPLQAELPRLQPGEVGTVRLRVWASAPGGAGAFTLEVVCADRSERVDVHVRGASTAADVRVEAARIERYPGGSRSAFAWRGDMDHYCTSTFQSIAGIGASFELGRRFRVPQTLFLSSRLTVDRKVATQFYEHFGVDRGQEEIPHFVQWLRDTVDFRLSAPYPWSSDKDYVVELGNHGHLHFGTDAAAAPENDWRIGARMGSGKYPWLSDETGSFAEQRDNAIECSRRFRDLFGFTPRSWAMPDRTNDEHTARAMEAAGCEVLSDSNVRAVHNVICQPPPHHPEGTAAVELTKRYPGDPQHAYHYGMILYWIHRAWRRRMPVVFMSHQHLRLFDGPACARFTEAVLRYVVTRFNGDLFIDTVFGLGSYWKDAFSPAHRRLEASVESGAVVVANRGTRTWRQVPVEVALSGGRSTAVLVDVAAGETVRVPIVGTSPS